MSRQRFEELFDDEISGTQPDYLRGEAERLADGDPDREQLLADGRLIVSAARHQALALPGDAYFADLGSRIEEEMARAGLPARPLEIRRRAPLIATQELAASLAAAAAVILWLGAFVPTDSRAARSAGAVTPPPQYQIELLSFNVAAASKQRRTDVDHILEATRSYS
jgi:hypothetical protein